MQRLNQRYKKFLEDTPLDFTRYIYPEINWKNRLILLKGPKGVGKTTMLLQHIKRTFEDPSKAFYASVDASWFTTHTIVDLAEYLVSHGVTHLFLDEVHKYIGWDRQIKEIYDAFPKLHIVMTGSSMLQLSKTDADLSRRCRVYGMQGMSFREYLEFEHIAQLDVIPFDEILTNHQTLAAHITNQLPIQKYFEQYLEHGYYPFYKEEGDGFAARLDEEVDWIINVEIPAVEKVSFELVYKTKILLGILAELNPYTLNVSDLATKLGTSRDSVYKMLDLLQKAGLIRRLYQKSTGMKKLQKPEKILFENTNLMYALSPNSDIGTLRETFTANMFCIYKQSMPNKGDLLIDNKYIFKVGGKTKDFGQIANIPNSYVIADGIDVGFGNKIPMWLFGFLY